MRRPGTQQQGLATDRRAAERVVPAEQFGADYTIPAARVFLFVILWRSMGVHSPNGLDLSITTMNPQESPLPL